MAPHGSLPLVALAVSLTACTPQEAPQCQFPGQVPGCTEQDPELRHRVAQVKAQVEADTCFMKGGDTSACAWVDVHLDGRDFGMAESTGEAVLILDNFPTHSDGLFPLLVRYRNRLLGVYRIGADSRLAPVEQALRMPAGLHAALTAFATPEHLPAEALHGLGPTLREAYRDYSTPFLGHGVIVFSLLVEAIPHHPLLVAQRSGVLSPADLCDPSPEATQRMREHAQRYADSVAALIREKNVRFIHASFGDSLRATQDDWVKSCGTPLPGDAVLREKVLAQAPLYDVLFATPGVFTAHASEQATSAEDFPFDVPSERWPNRIRAGFMVALDSGLDAEGRGPHEGFTRWPEPGRADVYLNFGHERGVRGVFGKTPLLTVDSFGTDMMPFTDHQPSWINPLSLARVIHLRESRHAEEPMTDALIATLLEEMMPRACPDLPESRCVFQDPLRHGQVEAVRLGYRPREYVEPAAH